VDCMVARERTAGARRECLAQVFGRHVPDGREVRRCVGPESRTVNRLRASVSFTEASSDRTQLAAVDATAASLSGGEMRSVRHTATR